MTTFSFLVEAAAKSKYSDEHAFVNVFNHMTRNNLHHDHNAMMAEIQKAKTDINHPLHFHNISHEGFMGKIKSHPEHYHEEIQRAVHSITAIHNKIGSHTNLSHYTAHLSGISHGHLSNEWKTMTNAERATSKTDVFLRTTHPHAEKYETIRISMKKGGGSQLMSGGSKETFATGVMATKHMLNEHSDYAHYKPAHKTRILNEITEHFKNIANHLHQVSKTENAEQKKTHITKAKKILDDVLTKHPKLNAFMRREAMTGFGKFGKHSDHAAEYILQTANGRTPAKFEHISDINFEGKRARIALGKGPGREGTMRIDT